MLVTRKIVLTSTMTLVTIVAVLRGKGILHLLLSFAIFFSSLREAMQLGNQAIVGLHFGYTNEYYSNLINEQIGNKN